MGEGLIEVDAVLSGGGRGVRSGDGWRQSTEEPAGARAAVSILSKNRFNSLAQATLPSALLLVGMIPVTVLIPLQTSLILFCWSFLSSPVLSLFDLHIQVHLNVPQLLVVATSESPLLQVEYGIDVFCYPRLVVWVATHIPCWDNAFHTKINGVRNALSKPINVLSMWLTG